MNLELLQQFGKNVHRRCIDELHSMTDLYETVDGECYF